MSRFRALLGAIASATLIGASGVMPAEAGTVCDIAGTSEDDILIGTSDFEKICGFEGNDLLKGGAGIDRLRGSDGRDTMYAGPGQDLLVGGDGADVLSGQGGNNRLFGGNGADTLIGGPTGDELHGNEGPDVIDAFGGGVDSIEGDRGRDTCYVDASDNVLDCDRVITS